MKPPFSKQQLIEHLRDLGIEPGCVLMPHTSMKAIGPVEGGPDTVVQALLEAVGPKGTLVMPSFTFSFCLTGMWDRDATPSEMGILSEIVRCLPEAQRSLHPIYSVAAVGYHAKHYGNCMDENGVGDESPFPLLVEHDAILGLFGVGYNQGFTLGHHIEWQENVSYRYVKTFPGKVTDHSQEVKGAFSMLVRDLDKGVVTDYRKFGYMLEHAGQIMVGRFGWSLARVVKATDLATSARNWLRLGVPELMHRLNPDEAHLEKTAETLSW